MTKRELIDELSNKLDISKRAASDYLDALTETVTSRVKRGEKVQITGFGTFDLGKRAARRGVDPRTQEEIHIPEMKMPRFRAGKRLKEAVRE